MKKSCLNDGIIIIICAYSTMNSIMSIAYLYFHLEIGSLTGIKFKNQFFQIIFILATTWGGGKPPLCLAVTFH